MSTFVARRNLVAVFTILLTFALLPIAPGAANAGVPNRIAGPDRYATSAAVSRAEFPRGADTVFIVTGSDFADALAAGPAAATQNAPILLVQPNGLPDATANELRRLKPAKVYFVGGESSISPHVVNLVLYVSSQRLQYAQRIAGATREKTATMLAEKFLPNAGAVLLVNGWRFPDAVTAASAGAHKRMPVLLTGGEELSPATAAYLSKHRPGAVHGIGSPTAIDNRVMRVASKRTGKGVSRIWGSDRYQTNERVIAAFFTSSKDAVIASGQNFPDALVASTMSRRGAPLVLIQDSCATSSTRATIERYASRTMHIVGQRIQSWAWLRPCPSPPSRVANCSIEPQLRDPAALTVNTRFSLASDDDLLLDRRGSQWAPSASTMKVVTAVTAYAVLGPDFRIPTYLYPGNRPGTYVIVGGGDPTLRSGDSSYYWGAPSMNSLAYEAWRRSPSAVGFESNHFLGRSWHPNWALYEIGAGSAAPLEALMVDGGRIYPNSTYSPRTPTPSRDAANRFAQLTGRPLDTSLRADYSKGPVAVVHSQPVRTLVSQMLLESDNMIAEALARHVAIKQNIGSSYDVVPHSQSVALDALGIDTMLGFSGSDGSGLSSQSLVTPVFMDEVLRLIDDVPRFRELQGLLPANGIRGTLQPRLGDIPRGAVVAKTGTVDTGFGLAGFMTAADGRRIRFSVYVWHSGNGAVTIGNRNALDRIVSGAYRCGSRLAG